MDWPKLYRFAVAAGCGETVSLNEEGVAAVDELLSRSLPERLVLGLTRGDGRGTASGRQPAGAATHDGGGRAAA